MAVMTNRALLIMVTQVFIAHLPLYTVLMAVPSHGIMVHQAMRMELMAAQQLGIMVQALPMDLMAVRQRGVMVRALHMERVVARLLGVDEYFMTLNRHDLLT
jgi:hypothetical protein